MLSLPMYIVEVSMKASWRALFFSQHASGVNEGAKGAGVEVIDQSGITEEAQDDFWATHLALFAPDALEDLVSQPG